MSLFSRLCKEPPFRLIVREIVRYFPTSLALKDLWNASDRPQYLAGVRAAARQARKQNVSEISVIEFGVAAGNGLLCLQKTARAVEREFPEVKIHVYGFDTGKGLPTFCPDFRDHPDLWAEGQYPMNEPWLRSQLDGRSQLVLGVIGDTIPAFVAAGHPPVGFMAIDVDLYSSTRDALQVLSLEGRKNLNRVFLYLDDITFVENHRFAGELLAIDEFNDQNDSMKIDTWRGIEKHRPFFESTWLKQMYVAHDLAAISAIRPRTRAAQMPVPVG